MNYYEELGLRSDASVPQIRQAYKVLARLVHPDNQGDDLLREMAQRQMKRLNEILATLTDAQKRRDYDRSLYSPPVVLGAGTYAPVPSSTGATARVAAIHRPSVAHLRPRREPWRAHIPGWANVLLLNWFWFVLAAVILSVGCWYVAAGNSTPVAVTIKPAAAVPPDGPREPSRVVPKTPSQKLRQPAHAVTQTRAAGLRHDQAAAAPRAIEMLPGNAPTASEPVRPNPSQAAENLPVVAKQESGDVLVHSEPATPSFAGNWLYVPENGAPLAPGAYAATYVEFLLTEAHGELSGDYRAHFRVPDLAMSPEVSFRARGKLPAGDSANLGWISANGSRGELQMTLRGPDLMSVTWWTTELGRQASLASGTAKLVRQRAP
jgi:hypothetical protein